MALLVDTVNLFYCTRKAYGSDVRINYQKYIEVVEKLFGVQEDKIAYITKPDNTAIKFIDSMRILGFRTGVKEPRPIRVGTSEEMWTNFNVELTVDAMCLADENEAMIIGSNDPHLTPLIEELNEIAGAICVYAVGAPKFWSKYATLKEVKSKVLWTHESV